MTATPLAIIGRACLIPGAASPEELWRMAAEASVAIGPPPPDRWIGGPPGTAGAPDRDLSHRGGYVTNAELSWDPGNFDLPAGALDGVDPVVRWTLETVRTALQDAGRPEGVGDGTGLIMGNLSYPTTGLVRFAESTWLSSTPGLAAPGISGSGGSPNPTNRFMSGLPAALAADALGLEAGSFALDAACASSLYAVKLAGDWLDAGRADVVVAGAVCSSDHLLIHDGFGALTALSRTGQSRPFDRRADGLLPAEGAAFVVLKRLEDALRAGDRIYGVVRGVGLSNDGRGQGLLVPSEEGQVRAIRAAYERGAIDPSTISYVECHATGTVVGDATELRSMATLFGPSSGIAVGSLKYNLGHLVTVSGVAGLIKVLGAMAEATLPPMPVEQPIEDLDRLGFRVLSSSEEWPGPRRAAISSFGFGGNNAHLVLDPPESVAGDDRPGGRLSMGVTNGSTSAPGAAHERQRPASVPIAIVGIGARVGQLADRAAFADAVLGDVPTSPSAASLVELPLSGLRFTPVDLHKALGQQTLVFAAALEAVAEVRRIPWDKTSVLVGIEADPDVTRPAVKLRLPEWSAPGVAGPEWLERAGASILPEYDSAFVLGAMPNIPANRLNRQLGALGPSFTVSAGEGSGLVAVDLASEWLRRGEIDAAVVGAADLSVHPVHAEAARQILPEARQVPGDAALVLVLKRLADAEADGDRVLAILDEPADQGADEAPRGIHAGACLGLDAHEGSTVFTERFGHSYAASGLLHLGAAALCLHHRSLPNGQPWTTEGRRRARVIADNTGRGARQCSLSEATSTLRRPERDGPRILVFTGDGDAGVLASLERGLDAGWGSKTCGHSGPPEGPSRLVIVAGSDAELSQRAQRARDHVLRGAPPGVGVHYRREPLQGEVAFVYPAAGAAYQGMGRDLLRALPELGDRLTRQVPFPRIAQWIYADTPRPPSAAEFLWSTSALSYIHTDLTRGVLDLQPDAMIGYSSGETNTLFAGGAWTDYATMRDELDEAGVMHRELGGTFDVLARQWGGRPAWQMWTVVAPAEEVLSAIGDEPRVHLAIVNTPTECVVAGEEAATRAVCERLGLDRCFPVDYRVVCHVPEAKELEDVLRRVHTRAVSPTPGVRYYSNAISAAYEPSPEACAEAIVGQFVGAIDFNRTIEQAYADGVRTFVEHGPRRTCTRWIREILGDRPHLAVALDRSGHGLDATLDAVASLVAASVPVDYGHLESRLTAFGRSEDPAADDDTRTFRIPARLPPVELPALETVDPPTAVLSAPLYSPVAASVATSTTDEPHGTELGEVMVAPPAVPLPLGQAVVRHPASAPPGRTATNGGGSAHPATSSPLAARLQTLGETHRQVISRLAGLHQRYLAARPPGTIGRAPAELDDTLTETKGAPPPTLPVQAVSVPEPDLARRPDPARYEDAGNQPGQIPANGSHPMARPPDVGREEPLEGPRSPRGITFTRADLEVHAGGAISTIFGPQFAEQDQYPRQTRMPEPPLLLADRVTGLDAEALSMGTGVIWTETDVKEDSWYLHDGYMPGGIMIEAGQADLMLISYLGIDLLNRGERVYRLLGCRLIYEGDLPCAGETLQYEIHIDGHARFDDVRLFFFHYDCFVDGKLRLRVRDAQAGFFSDEALAGSAGILWDPEHETVDGARLDPPAVACDTAQFGRRELEAFAAGRTFECFGRGFEPARVHQRSPRIQEGEQLLVDEVTAFDPTGGPWGRGYLRAEKRVSPEDWYFRGHFKNDPCMPGSLMCDATNQVMAFYLAAVGYTLDHDGWRFQPVTGQPFDLKCRGQVDPETERVVYEIFVHELVRDPVPTLYVDVLGTADGVKAFHGHRIGLQLVPDWPMSSRPELLAGHVEPKPAAVFNDREMGYATLLRAAWGRPSEAFGDRYAEFDGPRRVVRLPGPPYHFMSRVLSLDAGHVLKPGDSVEVEYDFPEEAWFFTGADRPTASYPAILEAGLQACGWLSCAGEALLEADGDLCYRNLDGTATLHSEIGPGDTLRTVATLNSKARSGEMVIHTFEVSSYVGDRLAHEMKTLFGFFPADAFAQQPGLPCTVDQRDQAFAPCDYSSSPVPEGGPPGPGPMLLMLDRITGWWPHGGKSGLGRIRAEREVEGSEWYFKAHFYQDPVQPGSLGVEALLQVLQWAMGEEGLGETARLQPLAPGRPLTWKYRGQVLPSSHTVTCIVDVTHRGTDERGPYLVGDGGLWVDGTRIYEVTGLSTRAVPGSTPR